MVHQFKHSLSFTMHKTCLYAFLLTVMQYFTLLMKSSLLTCIINKQCNIPYVPTIQSCVFYFNIITLRSVAVWSVCEFNFRILCLTLIICIIAALMTNYYTDYESVEDVILFHTPFYEKLSHFILKFYVSDKIYLYYSFIVAYLTAVGLITYYCATKYGNLFCKCVMLPVTGDWWLCIMIHKSQPIF